MSHRTNKKSRCLRYRIRYDLLEIITDDNVGSL